MYTWFWMVFMRVLAVLDGFRMFQTNFSDELLIKVWFWEKVVLILLSMKAGIAYEHVQDWSDYSLFAECVLSSLLCNLYQYHRISGACSMCTSLLDPVTISQAALCAYPNMLRKELRLSQRQLAAKEMSCLLSLVQSDGCQAEAHLSNELLGEHELVIRFRWSGKSTIEFSMVWSFDDLHWFAMTFTYNFLICNAAGSWTGRHEAFAGGVWVWMSAFKDCIQICRWEGSSLSLWASFQRHFHWRLLLGLFPPSPSLRPKLEEMRLDGQRGSGGTGWMEDEHCGGCYSLKRQVRMSQLDDAWLDLWAVMPINWIHLFLNLPTIPLSFVLYLLCFFEVVHLGRWVFLKHVIFKAQFLLLIFLKSEAFFDPGTWRLAAQCGVHVATERSRAWRPETITTTWMHTGKLQEMYGIQMTELELDPNGVVNVLCKFSSFRFTGGRELLVTRPDGAVCFLWTCCRAGLLVHLNEWI